MSDVDEAVRVSKRLGEIGMVDLHATAVLLERRGAALDATLPGKPPTDADRRLAVVPLPHLDLGPEGDLRIGEVIGEGGMGNVSIAEQRALMRDVAVKTLRHELAADPGAAYLLVDEARITGALEHPNIVPIHALGVDGNGHPVMVMKRLAGRVWRETLHATNPEGHTLPALARDLFGRSLETLMQVCNAVHFAHSRGVVHRDIKPENVMVGEHGEVYLLDWGAALAYRDAEPSEAIVGTLAYMAPEMLRGAGPEIGPTTDVYLLGATLHEVLTGTAPHAATDVQGALLSICRSEIAAFPRWVPQELADLCRRSLSLDPARRPQTVLEFKQAIADYITHRGSVDIARAATERLRRLAGMCEPGTAATLAESDERSAEVNRLFIECAFGYRQALEAWSNNPEARAGLQEAYEHMIRFEIVRKNPAAASSLLSQLPEVRVDLLGAVEDLRAKVAGEGRELARLRTLVKQQDPTVASGDRAIAALVTGVCLAVLFGWLSQRFPGARGLSHRGITAVTLAIMAGLAGITIMSRERVLGNEVNRYLTATMFSIVLTVVFIHVAGMIMDAPLTFALIVDFFVSGAMTATVGYNIHRGMVVVGLTYFLGALAAAFAPQHVLEAMAVTFLLAQVALAFTWRALAREARAGAG